MYLASTIKNGIKHYQIRQSFFLPEKDAFGHRTIFDLGEDPERFLEHPSEDICFFSEELEETISRATDGDATLLLESLLWEFLPEEEKHRLSIFKNRGRVKLSPLSQDEQAVIERDVHFFDRRRLYYLRYGAVDQSRIFRLNPKLYRPLIGQSRDEKEYYFTELEKDLKPNEMKTYVFAVFDLQRHFNESFSSTMPEALDQIDIADHFVEDLCTLNKDEKFWPDTTAPGTLHSHLVRYLIMFFDYGYGRRSLFDDFLREFMGRHRAFKWPDKKPDISTQQISDVFQKDWHTLRKMNKKELTRLYRRRAKELHPDKGGDHELFVALNSGYAALLARKI